MSMKDLYPYDAPGMPPMGSDLLSMAAGLGDVVEVKKGRKAGVRHEGQNLQRLLYQAVYAPQGFQLNLTIKGSRSKLVDVVPGHLWGRLQASGPEPADVMVVGKMLGEEELNQGRHLIGPTGQFLLDALRRLGIKGMSRWYVTNLLKCVDPDGGNSWNNNWIKEFLPLLHQELRLVRPKYILCLGADASKALLWNKATVSYMTGRVVELTYPVQRDHESEPQLHTSLVMTCTHPAAVLRFPEQQEECEFALARFGQLTRGIRWDRDEEGLDHRVIETEADLEALVYEVRTSKESLIPGKSRPQALIAVDAEWEGEHPQNAGSYVRTIQISWAHKRAACIVLTEPGGRELREGWIEFVVSQLKRMLKSTTKRKVRICGHFLNSDLEWLLPLGLDLREEFAAPERWEDCPYEGGFDTGLAAHALNEVDDFSLKTQLLKFTEIPRYDIALEQWKVDYCKQRGLKAKDLEGYGECPGEILFPYGNYDADGTRRLAINQMQRLYRDHVGNCCWEPFWITMRAYPGILEMNLTGLVADRKRIDELTRVYLTSRAGLEQKIREWARWDAFNIGSVFHVREFLYGEQLNGKKRDPGAPPVRIRPEGARTLRLTPLLTTGKRPMAWDEVVKKGLEDDVTPGTDKQILSMLAEESQQVVQYNFKLQRNVVLDYSQQVSWIRDHRFISQVLKSTLRPPVKMDDEDDYVQDTCGHWIYPSGLPKAICDDGFVRTHTYPTLETGRYGSSRPPLQNLTKNRERDYKIILGDNYKYALRSILMAPPGYVLVEADYIGAELYGMALMSGDRNMIDQCRRNQLPEDHPDYYDIHSNIAVMAFKLDCAPTKSAMKKIKKAELRNVAKAVIFGIAYGRGAKAIALQAKTEKVIISVEEAQQVIDTVFEMYPGLLPFFAECRRRALEERWLCGSMGRFRRFPLVPGYAKMQEWLDRKARGERVSDRPPLSSLDRQVMGDIERQAMNFPIQGLIADCVSRAIDHLMWYRTQFSPEELDYRLALQIHDALLLLVPAEHVPRVVNEVLPTCMRELVPIYPTTLDGIPTGAGPYHLGIETEVALRWSETMLPSECLELGIDPSYAHWKQVDGGYTHSNFPDKIWTPGGFQLAA